ncbi:glycosyltransferase [Methyloprofundus sp.]|uniref:glycosyltransferase n=1 Tax=Methyloprofundus sp. TaxID=2020875 RepID=UPI003D108815
MDFYCVIVTFNPDIGLFQKALKSILASTRHIIIIDNGSSNINDIRNIEMDFKLIPLSNNVGVAAAQNIGIKDALLCGAEHVWLSDQDTIYPDDYLDKICQCMKELEQRDVNYSVIGPAFIDTFNDKVQPVIKYTPFAQRIIPEKGVNFVSQLISSGMVREMERNNHPNEVSLCLNNL